MDAEDRKQVLYIRMQNASVIVLRVCTRGTALTKLHF